MPSVGQFTEPGRCPDAVGEGEQHEADYKVGTKKEQSAEQGPPPAVTAGGVVHAVVGKARGVR
jgi:hypothetical protein